MIIENPNVLMNVMEKNILKIIIFRENVRLPLKESSFIVYIVK